MTGTLIGKYSDDDLDGFLKVPYLKKKGIESTNIVFLSNTGSTYQEILSVKHYMIKNSYKNVIFVSEPTHSRRISILVDFLNYTDADLSYILVSSDVGWWNRSYFYNNILALQISIIEIIKLVHHSFVYN